MLNPQKIWHELLTDLSTSPVRCSHFTLGNQKRHFSTLLFIYFRLFTLAQKKTNSNCRTAALAVYLLLFSASYYLHSPSTASGSRCRRSVCIDMDMLRLAAVACCDTQRGVLCDWSVSKKTGSMYQCRRWSLWTLAVTLLAWHSSCHASQPVHFRATDNKHNWLFSEPPTLERTQQPFSQMKKCSNLQVSVVTYSGGVGRWITVYFRLR